MFHKCFFYLLLLTTTTYMSSQRNIQVYAIWSLLRLQDVKFADNVARRGVHCGHQLCYPRCSHVSWCIRIIIVSGIDQIKRQEISQEVYFYYQVYWWSDIVSSIQFCYSSEYFLGSDGFLRFKELLPYLLWSRCWWLSGFTNIASSKRYYSLKIKLLLLYYFFHQRLRYMVVKKPIPFHWFTQQNYK